MNCQTYCFRLLARRDYTRQELRKKALDKGFQETEIQETLDHLQAINAQSDSRVAEDLILGYQGKLGKPKIKQKCREKGIALELFEETWEDLADRAETEDFSDPRFPAAECGAAFPPEFDSGGVGTRIECLRRGLSPYEQGRGRSTADLKAKVMQKYKLTEFSNLDPKTKRKVCNFLQYRGFNPFYLLSQWQQEESEKL